MEIEEENKKIEENMRAMAKQLLENKDVDVILGYMKGTLPLSSTPIECKSLFILSFTSSGKSSKSSMVTISMSFHFIGIIIPPRL